MKAAWYEHQGSARDVLVVGEMDAPTPGEGEVRIRVEASGINPGDVKKRQDAFGVGMPFPRIVPHSDGAGTVDAVGTGVPDSWLGQRVWCYGAQTYRPFGTAAEYTVVPLHQACGCRLRRRWNKAPVSAFRALPHTGQYSLRAASQARQYWYKAAPARLAAVPSSLHIVRAHA
jgi:NADPH:quinone reductase-like Zn-dependent oxidoreductase